MKAINPNALAAENRELKERILYLEEILNKAPVHLYINQIDCIDNLSTRHNVWLNQRALDFLGYSQTEIDDMGCDYYHKVMHPEDVMVAEDTLNYLKTEPDSETYVNIFRVLDKNKEYKWANGHTYVFRRHPDGTPYQFLNAAFDFSNQVQTQWRLSEAMKEIARLNKQLHVKNISKREREVLQLVVKGLTDREIANVLFISERTAQTHRNRLIKKTGAKNTATLVAFAMECGLY